MKTSMIKQVPVILCRLLSPYTHRDEAQAILGEITANQALLGIVIECANQHHVLPTLYAQLEQQKLLSTLPDDLLDYMQTMHAFQQARNQRLKKQAVSIIETLNHADLVPLLLKGVDTLFSPLYPTTGSRFMSDLDILLPEGKVPTAMALLLEQGYTVPEKYRGHGPGRDPHHESPIYKDGDDCAIELHYKPLNSKSGKLLSTADAFAGSQNITMLAESGLCALSLSPSHKVMHCFAHSEISHGYQQYDLLDIRQMDYFVRLVHHYGDLVDWHFIQAELRKEGFIHDLAVYRAKAQRLFGLPTVQALPNPSASLIEQRYQTLLVSAMRQYYPFFHFKLGIMRLLGVFSKERLSRQFETQTALQYAVAVIRRSGQLLTRPIYLVRRMRSLLLPKRA